MKALILILSCFILISPLKSKAQKESTNFLMLKTKRINDSELYELIFKQDWNFTEQFNPSTQTTKYISYKAGLIFTFDFNFQILKTEIFSKGGLFNGYEGELPAFLKMGIHRDSIIFKNDNLFQLDNDNPYKLFAEFDGGKIDLYFTDKRLIKLAIEYTASNIDDQEESKFVRLIPIGKIISGDCEQDTGTMIWDKNVRYTGEWEYGIPHGKGTFTDIAGNIYYGEFKYGYFWGRGKLIQKEVSSYFGDFVLSRRQGEGEANFYQTSETYTGDWYHDYMQGFGLLTNGSKFIYKGNFIENKMTGNGKLSTLNGWIEGAFSNGVPNGYCKQYLKNESTLLEGNFVNGKKNGKFKITIKKTQIRETFFKNDIEVKS